MRQEPGMVAVRPDRIDGARGKRLQHQPPDFLLNLRIVLHFCRKLGSNLWPQVTQAINEGVPGGEGGNRLFGTQLPPPFFRRSDGGSGTQRDGVVRRDRKSVVSGKRGSERVDLGSLGSI